MKCWDCKWFEESYQVQDIKEAMLEALKKTHLWCRRAERQ